MARVVLMEAPSMREFGDIGSESAFFDFTRPLHVLNAPLSRSELEGHYEEDFYILSSKQQFF